MAEPACIQNTRAAPTRNQTPNTWPFTALKISSVVISSSRRRTGSFNAYCVVIVWLGFLSAARSIENLAGDETSLHRKKALRKIQSAFALRLKAYHFRKGKSIGVTDKEL